MSSRNRGIAMALLSLPISISIGCSRIDRAMNNGDVVSDYGQTANLEKFTAFLEQVEANQESRVRITRFTKEGDPIYWDLHYDGKLIQVKEDTRQDKLGGKQVFKYSCQGIQTTVAEKETSYDLTGCNSTRTNQILVVPNE